jgi:aldose 1-epimerase
MTSFGTTKDGTQVHKISLAAGDLRVDLLTHGARVQSVRLAGVAHDLTLGSEDLAEYEGGHGYHGALIAPVVNRLTGARAPLADRSLQLEVNFNGKHSLHSGPSGAHAQVWQVLRATASEAVLALDLPDGLGGFSGNRHIEAQYVLEAPATLRLTITAHSDAETVFNAANHSYWNLDGSADISGHSLRIAAEHYLPVDADFVVTGEVRAVEAGFDLRALQTLSAQSVDLDHCFCLSRAPMPLRDVLWLQGQSGLRMTLATTEAGVQVYDCRHDGFKGLAIEAHAWPDAPNKPQFTPISLAAGQTRQQVTEWRFDRG